MKKLKKACRVELTELVPVSGKGPFISLRYMIWYIIDFIFNVITQNTAHAYVLQPHLWLSKSSENTQLWLFTAGKGYYGELITSIPIRNLPLRHALRQTLWLDPNALPPTSKPWTIKDLIGMNQPVMKLCVCGGGIRMHHMIDVVESAVMVRISNASLFSETVAYLISPHTYTHTCQWSHSLQWIWTQTKSNRVWKASSPDPG